MSAIAAEASRVAERAQGVLPGARDAQLFSIGAVAADALRDERAAGPIDHAKVER